MVDTINLQYYEEFKKLYFTSYCISTQLRKVTKTKEDLLSRLEKLEVLICLFKEIIAWRK
jgi:hypothetical protein